MAVFLFWIVFSVIVAILGSSRRIGFGAALFVSILLSPVIGFIVVICSQRKSNIEFQKRMLAATESKSYKKNSIDATSEIDKILDLRSKGIITEDEYQKMKQKIIDSIN